jgi:hypothetical protein
MLLQYLLIGLLFATALFFMGRRVWQAFFAKSESACAKGCGACSTIDVDALQRTIEARVAQQSGR